MAVVTGAASGIGRALAVALGARGARLALSDVQADGLAVTAEAARGAGAPAVRTYALDVADRAAVVAHAAQVRRDFGAVNALFNNAGVSLHALATEQRAEDLDWLLGIDLHGVIHGTQAFLPHLIASGDGCLVNVSSVFGLIAVPGQSAYNAAKFGVRGYTEAVALEMELAGHPVTVHCVHPGGIRTEIARSGRAGASQDAAAVARHFDSVALTRPEDAARAILRGVERGRRRILVGPDAHVIHAASQLLGTRVHRLIARVTRGTQGAFTRRAVEPPVPDVPGPPIRTEVAIIGAGFGGMGAAIQLGRAGVRDVVILEAGSEVGGTWRDNTYPGAACDIPSHLYSFSFESADWSQAYAGQREIQDYLVGVSHRYRLRDRLYLRRRVREAAWQERERVWRITCDTGEVFEAPALVAAIGGLRDPAYPDIPGRDTFAGPTMHSARWDASVPLAGRRVGVIGTGASAIQIVPALAPRVGELRLFQRTPAWVLPRGNRPYSAPRRLALRLVPGAQRLHRWRLYLSQEARFLGFGRLSPLLSGPTEAVARRHIRRHVPDPDLQRRLTPDYRLGCKRVLIDDAFYPAVASDHVTLVDQAVDAVTSRGVVTRDGQEHPLDVLVYATGFRIDQPLGDLRVVGREGRVLSDVWAERPGAYLGMAVPDFPNLFTLVGPNVGLGHNSIVFVIECQLRTIVPAVRRILDEAVTLDVAPESLDAFLREVDERTAKTVWHSGCRSWYLTEDGTNFVLWPGSTLELWWRTRRFDPAAYRIRR